MRFVYIFSQEHFDAISEYMIHRENFTGRGFYFIGYTEYFDEWIMSEKAGIEYIGKQIKSLKEVIGQRIIDLELVSLIRTHTNPNANANINQST